MIVVHIIKATGIAGAERHLLTLLPGLRERGIDTRIVLLHPPANRPAAWLTVFTGLLEAAGVPVTCIPISGHLDVRVIGRIRAVLKAIRPNIVHTHLLHADLYGLAAAMQERIAIRITSRHNDDSFRRRLVFQAINRASWRLGFTAGIAISHAVARFCAEVEGAPPGKLHTIHYGLPLPAPLDRRTAQTALHTLLNVPPDAPLIGGVGRLIAQKGYDTALRAFDLLATDFPAAHLVLIGDGGQRPVLEAEARRLGLLGKPGTPARVHFIGWRDDAAELMAGLDVFIMPSRWEGFGLVLLEAMSRALPVVGSAVSAIPEVVIDGETGLLVPPDDAPALADALRSLLADPPLARHMGMMGENRLEEFFTAGRMIDSTVALYTQVTPP